MKRLFIFLAAMLSIVWLISAVAFINKKNEFPEKHLELVLRNIGHQLLLHAKDSTSRVLPVKKISEHVYQLSFQHSFGFVPDTLVNLVNRQLQHNNLPNQYIVTVKDCQQQQTFYAFEMNAKADNTIPCKGREQAVGCYLIDIEFLQKASFDFSLLLLLLIPLCFAAYYAKNRFKQKQPEKTVSTNNGFTQLGQFTFYAEKNLLNHADKMITLTDKETKALKIFAQNTNQVIERETLMKAIWEDEGIVVMSRNVDVLVSKLRKKLNDDPTIKIINVHGRGYKFMIEQEHTAGFNATT